MVVLGASETGCNSPENRIIKQFTGAKCMCAKMSYAISKSWYGMFVTLTSPGTLGLQAVITATAAKHAHRATVNTSQAVRRTIGSIIVLQENDANP